MEVLQAQSHLRTVNADLSRMSIRWRIGATLLFQAPWLHSIASSGCPASMKHAA
jgi:hypothetical protein